LATKRGVATRLRLVRIVFLPDHERVYNLGLYEFIGLVRGEPRPGFRKGHGKRLSRYT